MSDPTIKGLKGMLDRDASKAQSVIDKFKEDINDPETQLLWALRQPASVIGAAVALRRIAQVRTMINSFETAVDGSDKDPNYTATITSELGGELTEAACIAYIDATFTKELIQYGRCGRRIGQNELEHHEDMKWVANFLDDKLFRWYY